MNEMAIPTVTKALKVDSIHLFSLTNTSRKYACVGYFLFLFLCFFASKSMLFVVAFASGIGFKTIGYQKHMLY